MKAKVVKEAYRFTFNWCDSGGTTLVHGETRGKAKMEYLRQCDCYGKEILDIRGRRDKAFDLVEQEPNADAKILTEEQVKIMSHAIGHDYYKAEPYRNYYQVREEPLMEALIPIGLIAKDESMGLNYYYLTKRGLTAIRSLHPIYRINLNLKSNH